MDRREFDEAARIDKGLSGLAWYCPWPAKVNMERLSARSRRDFPETRRRGGLSLAAAAKPFPFYSRLSQGNDKMTPVFLMTRAQAYANSGDRAKAGLAQIGSHP